MIDSSPTFVGFEPGGGSLYSWVRENPQGIVVFEELDKVDPKVIEALYPFIEEGRAIDSNTSKEARFTRGVIILTSNFGSIVEAADRHNSKACDLIDRWDRHHLFGEEDELVADWDEDRLKNEIFKKLAKFGALNPQVVGRIGISNIIIFHHLTKAEIGAIRDIYLKSNEKNYKEKNINLKFTPDLRDWLVEKAWGVDGSDTFNTGARALQSVVEDNIVATLELAILGRGAISKPETWELGHDGSEVTLKVNGKKVNMGDKPKEEPEDEPKKRPEGKTKSA